MLEFIIWNKNEWFKVNGLDWNFLKYVLCLVWFEDVVKRFYEFFIFFFICNYLIWLMIYKEKNWLKLI